MATPWPPPSGFAVLDPRRHPGVGGLSPERAIVHFRRERTMPATTRTAHCFKTVRPTPRRFLRCIACGTIKKERPYALCSECYKLNGTLEHGLFTRLARRAEREGKQYSYRSHPEFEKACRIYARRRQRERAEAEIDAYLPRYQPRDTDPRTRYQHEPYDGLGGYDLGDVLDWQRFGTPLPMLERSEHRELTDAEIAQWDARVDAWAKARGIDLSGARTWTDHVA